METNLYRVILKNHDTRETRDVFIHAYGPWSAMMQAENRAETVYFLEGRWYACDVKSTQGA